MGFYHVKVAFADGSVYTKLDSDEEGVLYGFLIPFINGHVMESNYEGTGVKILVNMKAALNLSIYHTESIFKDLEFYSEGMGPFNSEEIKKYDVTHEFIDKAKKIQADAQGSSLLQKAFSQIKDQVFVVMKFGDKHLDSAYQNVVKPLCENNGLRAVRVDEIQDSGKITDQILESIAESKFVLVDLTGERPNCYYEAGFAHALGKNVIFTIRQDSKVHFDLSGYRFIFWETELELKKSLDQRFAAILR